MPLGLGVVVIVAAPLGLYYGLRVGGVGIYLALLASAFTSVMMAAIPLIMQRRINRLAIYMMTMMLASLGVSLLAGSPRFLLAKDAWVTGLTGIWFLASLWGRRPLAFVFSRPLVEGRLRWPDDWDTLWQESPRFRRMWRISTALWGAGTLIDAAARVVMAYTLAADVVPALGAVLYGATSLVLIVVTSLLYIASGVYNPRSALYAPFATSPRSVATPR